MSTAEKEYSAKRRRKILGDMYRHICRHYGDPKSPCAGCPYKYDSACRVEIDKLDNIQFEIFERRITRERAMNRKELHEATESVPEEQESIDNDQR